MSRDTLAQQAAQPAQQAGDERAATDISTELREYAGNPGYSHGDYADVMRRAADECERFYGGMLAVPEGWALIPKYPDQRMINAFIAEYERPGGSENECYRAMLAAAPAQAPAGPEGAMSDKKNIRELVALAAENHIRFPLNRNLIEFTRAILATVEAK